MAAGDRWRLCVLSDCLQDLRALEAATGISGYPDAFVVMRVRVDEGHDLAQGDSRPQAS
ncbi:MAG TPA: hypothetical protein VOB72_18855 [Candidatus Dormibacteraeota bacterium]|nr:hypothetical protein [Candidatus Dormibacteraeota bacterium]